MSSNVIIDCTVNVSWLHTLHCASRMPCNSSFTAPPFDLYKDNIPHEGGPKSDGRDSLELFLYLWAREQEREKKRETCYSLPIFTFMIYHYNSTVIVPE